MKNGKSKILDEFKNVFTHIKNEELRNTIRRIILKAPKYFWTVDNKELQKKVINAVNALIRLRDKFKLNDKELDICISSIILSNICQYSETEEIWRDKEIVEDHPNVVFKYLKKKCPQELAYLNTIGICNEIFNCVQLHESQIDLDSIDKLSTMVNLSFYLSSLDISGSNKEVTIEDLIFPNIF